MSDLVDLERRIGDLERRLANMVKMGTVVAANYTDGKARVLCDDFTTDWLPWKTRRAGGDIDWWAPEIGEQVEVLSPSGLTEGAWIGAALYSDQFSEPEASPDRHTVRYKNGDSIIHDRTDGSYVINLLGPVTINAGGPALIKTPHATIEAQDTDCTGNLTVDGKITGKGGMAISGGDGATMQIQGAMSMKGSMDVDGSIAATGTIMDAGGNSNHHSH
ncbi:phage baseplate assembly protein V [Alcaligenaceae bacterium]|nr:phage baseplate assembly protein V [Alcaligenaceae bacterium]